MSPTPQHGTPAGDAFLAIQKLARSTGGNVQELLTLYALEGLLARVAASRYREDFVLKGGVLLAAFSLRRPTRDIDLQATGIANDPTTVLTRVTDIAAIDADDGLTFDPQKRSPRGRSATTTPTPESAFDWSQPLAAPRFRSGST